MRTRWRYAAVLLPLRFEATVHYVCCICNLLFQCYTISP